MKSNFLNAGAIVSAAFIVAVAPSARAENFHAHYSVSLIGLPIGAATADAAIGQSAYKIDFSVKLTGLAAMVSSAKAALASSGSVNHGVVTPLTYATTSANSRETRTLRMALNGGSVRAVEYSPPWEDKSPDRVPLTEADKRNIIDPLSAFIMPVPAADLVGPSACNRTVPVYDGYTRFDVTLSFVGHPADQNQGLCGAGFGLRGPLYPDRRPQAESGDQIHGGKPADGCLACADDAGACRHTLPGFVNDYGRHRGHRSHRYEYRALNRTHLDVAMT